MDWKKTDLEEVLRRLGGVKPKCPDGSPQFRAVETGAMALLFLVGKAQRAWFLRHYRGKVLRTAYQRAHYEYLLAEEALAAVKPDERSGDEVTDWVEVLQRLNDLGSQYPKGSPTSKALETIADAVVSVSTDAVRARFIRFLQSRDEPMKEHQEKWHTIAMGEEKPDDGDSNRGQGGG